MIIEGIGIGMLLSYFMTETIGLAAGGIVVPGYIALQLHHPFRVLITFLLGGAVFFITKILGQVMILYGRRLLLLSIIIGYLLGYFVKAFPPLTLDPTSLSWEVIGYVIPGLIAYWSHRQGIIETFSCAIVASVITRLILIIISKGRMFE